MCAIYRLISPLAAVLTLTAGLAMAQERGLPARFDAVAVSLGGIRSSAGISQMEIAIERWSTAAESQRLMAVLKDKGAAQLVDALRDVKSVGTIRTPGNLAYDLRFAYVEPGKDGGRRIVLATDRPISFWEAVNRPRVSDYPFTFIELRLPAEGDGEGKLALATKLNVSRDGKTIELENYDTQPIALNQVRQRSR